MCDSPNCTSERVMGVNAKCSDMCNLGYEVNYCGYVPNNIGLGYEDDYIEFDYCLECGKIQGRFPIEDPDLGE